MFDVRAVKANFGETAAQYDEHALLQKNVRAGAMALAEKYFPRDAHILDLGCGTGALAGESRWRLTGCDLAPGMCMQAKRRLRAVNADACALPFAEAAFDGVFSSLMLQWVDGADAAFAEMLRVTKAGGHAVMSTLAEGTLQELAAAFAAIDAYPHVSAFSMPHAVIESAEKSGWSLVSARAAPVVEHYPDTVALMRALQAIGATNKQQARRRGLMTPRQFSRLERAYPHTPRGVPATWQVLYLVLRKS